MDVTQGMSKLAATSVNGRLGAMGIRNLLELRAPREAPASSRPNKSKNHMLAWPLRKSGGVLRK